MTDTTLHHILHRLLLLVCMGLATAYAHAQINATSIVSGTTYRIKCGGTNNGASDCPYLADVDGTLNSQAASANTWQQWVVTAVDGEEGFYTVKNVSTGKYLVPVTNKGEVATVSTGEAMVYLKKSEKNDKAKTEESYFLILKDAAASISYNVYAETKIAGWQAEPDVARSGSDWGFIPVDQDAAQDVAGEAKPVAGDTYYTIHSQLPDGTKQKIGEADGKATLMAEAVSGSADYSQYWQLVDCDGKLAFRNVLTGHYIQGNSASKNGYTTGTEPYGFTVSENEHALVGGWRYDVKDTDSYGFNSTDKGQLYSWGYYDGTDNYNSLWWFKAVPAREQHLSEVQYKSIVRIRTAMTTNYGSYAGGYITDTYAEGATGYTCVMRAEKATTDDDYNRQLWALIPNGDGYSLRNLATGHYMGKYYTSATAEKFYIRYNSTISDNTSQKMVISTVAANDKGKSCLHYQATNDVVVGWNEDAGASNWLFETVDMTKDAVRAIFDKMDNRYSSAADAAGKWVRIRNLNGSYMEENITSHAGEVNALVPSDVAQVWKLTAVADKDGYYQLQNALTERYLQFTTHNAAHSTGTDATDGGYRPEVLSAAFPFESRFAIHPANLENYSVHRSGSRLITWNNYNGNSDTYGSVWSFESTGITDADVEKARAELAATNEAIANADAYTTALAKYFTDGTCLALADAYKTLDDDALRQAMAADGIGNTTLLDMAVKVKNDTWAEWERTFRVQQVQPFSDPWAWNDALKVGYVYTNLSNPTGIASTYGQPLYVMVGDDIPDGCSMAAVLVDNSESQGTETALKKGLNVVQPLKENVALFIRYTVPTSLADTETKVADFKRIPIHVEGGTVNGYFDLTRTADGIGTDEAWKQMLADGLITRAPICQMKGERTVFNMNSTLVKQYVPEQMAEIIGFWDWVLQVEHETAGIDVYSDRWNNYMGCYSVTHGYMYATSYGTYYHEDTLPTVLTYDDGKGGGMKYSGGALWGPAHEMGHIHQQLFNMIGCTEISNNVFSNAVLFRNGRTTTRTGGASIATIAEKFANGTPWHDYTIWERTRMYFQLYLYYHVQGHKPDFYPRLFDALRADPIIRKHDDGSAVPATEDFLHFALKCCEVSGDDLSEFFAAYGMFVPFEQRTIDDYGTFPTYGTQEEMDVARQTMQSYKKPEGNILFIEDHIRLENAVDHDGNPLTDADGNLIKRTDYEANCAVGTVGDVGQYTDYDDGNLASGYTCTVGDDGTVTMKGEGAVGYKVYDPDGTLLYFSNKNTFTLPDAVRTKLGDAAPVIKAAQADGTDVTLPSGESHKVTVYRAASNAADHAQILYTDLSSATLPVLSGNDVAYVSGDDAVADLTSLPNYVNADDNTAESLVITDLADFVAPHAITARSLSYTRTLRPGYNSYCLPFPVTAADFGEGAHIDVFTGTTQSDGITYLHFASVSGTLPAGTPCLVWIPEEVADHEFSLADAQVTNTTVSADSPDGTLALKGSFTLENIGAGRYKLASDGKRFGITTEKGIVAPFRAYLEPLAALTSAPLSFGIAHTDAPAVGIKAPAADTTAPAAIYDLSGRPVAHPVRGGIYIVSGRKVVK